MKDLTLGTPGRGLARRREVQQMLQQLSEVQGRHINRAVECLIHNATFADLPVYSVLKCRGSALPADQAKDFNLSKNFVLRGERPGCNESRVAILQQPAEQGQVIKAIYAGVTPVRIQGERGLDFATTEPGETYLVASDCGQFEILWDEADLVDGWAGYGERYALVRFGVPSECPECSGSSGSSGSSDLSSDESSFQSSGSSDQSSDQSSDDQSSDSLSIESESNQVSSSGSGGSSGASSDGSGSSGDSSGGSGSSGDTSGGSSGQSSGQSSGASSGDSSGASSGQSSGGSETSGDTSGGSSSGVNSSDGGVSSGGGSGSDKSTAIVPASWSPTGYTALFVEEQPEVRFDDVIETVVSRDCEVPIDPRYVEVCEPGSISVCGWSTNMPILVGCKVFGDYIDVRLGPNHFGVPIELTLRLTGIRKGFAGHRFPDRTEVQYLANERFIKSAYPGAGS